MTFFTERVYWVVGKIKEYMTENWLTKALREHRPLNLAGHINRPRISAETILKMVTYKNNLLGIKRSLHEESLISEEKNEQVI